MLWQNTGLNVLFQSFLFCFFQKISDVSMVLYLKITFFSVPFFLASSRCRHFGSTILYIFKIGSGLLLSHGTVLHEDPYIFILYTNIPWNQTSKPWCCNLISKLRDTLIVFMINRCTTKNLNFLISRWASGNAQIRSLIMWERTLVVNIVYFMTRW